MAAHARPTEVASTVAGMVADQTAPWSEDVARAAPRRRNHHPAAGHVGHDIPNLSHRMTVRRAPDGHEKQHVSVVAVSPWCR